MKLVEARKKERYSQGQAAKYLGMSRPTYAKLEKNPELMTVGDAIKIAELFKVSISDIFFAK